MALWLALNCAVGRALPSAVCYRCSACQRTRHTLALWPFVLLLTLSALALRAFFVAACTHATPSACWHLREERRAPSSGPGLDEETSRPWEASGRSPCGRRFVVSTSVLCSRQAGGGFWSIESTSSTPGYLSLWLKSGTPLGIIFPVVFFPTVFAIAVWTAANDRTCWHSLASGFATAPDSGQRPDWSTIISGCTATTWRPHTGGRAQSSGTPTHECLAGVQSQLKYAGGISLERAPARTVHVSDLMVRLASFGTFDFCRSEDPRTLSTGRPGTSSTPVFSQEAIGYLFTDVLLPIF